MKKKAITTLCCLLTLVNTIPVNAAEYTAPQNTSVATEFNKESIFTVTLPESISGSNGMKLVNFNYGVEGDISADTKVTVNIEDKDTSTDGIQLKLNDGKVSKYADISIEKNDFLYDEITTKLTKQGTVTFDDLTAGTWKGNAKFLVDLENAESTPIEYIPFTLTANNYTQTGIEELSGDVVIPETFEYDGVDYKVTSIGKNAFYNRTGLTSVTIPDSVTSIENNAFYNCTSLTDITIPNSVTSISSSAFSGRTNPTSIAVDSANTVYDSRDNCNAIIKTASNTLIKGCKNTVIPENVTVIGQGAFSDCIGLTNITIPESVTSIENNAFGNCTDLTNITIPNSITSIKSNAFYNVPHITYNGTATGSPWGALAIN